MYSNMKTHQNKNLPLMPTISKAKTTKNSMKWPFVHYLDFLHNSWIQQLATLIYAIKTTKITLELLQMP